jgi:hypothetical protein
MFFLLFLIFSPTKLENKRAEQVLPKRGLREGGPNNVYHVSKCKNNKKNKK